jgi:hypothetical protein
LKRWKKIFFEIQFWVIFPKEKGMTENLQWNTLVHNRGIWIGSNLADDQNVRTALILSGERG